MCRTSQSADAVQAPVTLLHEIIHVINEIYDLDDDEKRVKAFSCGIAQALQSIGWMPRAFTESDPRPGSP